MVRELIPDPFANALGAAVGGASSGAVQTITLTGATTWKAGDYAFTNGEAAFWGYLGNPGLPASMEVVRVIQTVPSVVVVRGADGRSPVSHDVTHLFGPALRGAGIVALIASATSTTDDTVTEHAAALVAAATRIRTPAERLYLSERFG